MGTAALIIYWVGAIATSTYYWFAHGRTQHIFIGRFKTTMAFFVWYLYVAYLIFVYFRSASSQAGTDEAKKRILD
jgi:hypothetical protein